MSRLTRILHKVFGINGDTAYQFSKFGGFKNGSPEYAATPELMQSLTNYETGLYGSVVGDNAPILQDFNSAMHVMSRQTGYLFQEGIPEWDTDSVYYIGSIAKYNGYLWTSLVDNNSGHSPVDGSTYWKLKFSDISYDANISYSEFSIVNYNQAIYVSTENSNKGNTPSISSTHWQSINDLTCFAIYSGSQMVTAAGQYLLCATKNTDPLNMVSTATKYVFTALTDGFFAFDIEITNGADFSSPFSNSDYMIIGQDIDSAGLGVGINDKIMCPLAPSSGSSSFQGKSSFNSFLAKGQTVSFGVIYATKLSSAAYNFVINARRMTT